MIDTRRLADNLTDAMVRLLHFQEKGEPDWANLTYAAARDLCNDVPQSLIDRYRNEILFHNQVQRAVSTVLQLVQEAERATHQPIAVTGNCGLCGQPRADHAEVAPDGKPECRMKENSHHG